MASRTATPRDDRRTRGFDRADGGVRRRETAIDLLAESGDDEERVVDAHAEPYHGGDVQHEHGHGRVARRDGDQAERDRDREEAYQDRQGGGDQRAEGDDQHRQGEREGALLASLGVLRADGAHIVVQRREPGHHHLEPVRAGDPCQPFPDRGAQVGDEAGAQIVRGLGRERGNEERRAPILTDEARLADRAGRDHFPHVGAALDGGLERVEHGLEAGVGPADRTVHDDRHVVGEGGRKRLLQELGRPVRFGGLATTAPEREHLLDVAGPRPEQEREGRPCHDDPPTPSDDGCRG